jgi:hypothetical protein
VDDLRAAAAGADVEYLVLGSASVAVSASARSRPAMLPTGPSLVRQGLPFPRPPAPGSSAFVSVNVHVIDVATGELVRSAVAQGGPARRALPPPVLIPALILGGLGARPGVTPRMTAAGLAIPFVTPKLDARVDHALAEIAQTLNLSGRPAPVDR